MLNAISTLDWFALIVFFAVWIGFTWFTDHSRWSVGSLQHVMDYHRRRWMREMLKRDMRMPDALLVGNFVQSAVFFASTAILVVGGLVAILGSSDKALAAISSLPFVTPHSESEWALKVVTLICVFIYSFFKFIWALRLANYSSVLFNAAPLTESEAGERYAVELGRIATLFGFHFNQGLRANFFALAILAWLINAWFFIVSTLVVLAVLYRREFRSKSLRVVKNLQTMCEESDEY